MQFPHILKIDRERERGTSMKPGFWQTRPLRLPETRATAVEREDGVVQPVSRGAERGEARREEEYPHVVVSVCSCFLTCSNDCFGSDAVSLAKCSSCWSPPLSLSHVSSKTCHC